MCTNIAASGHDGSVLHCSASRGRLMCVLSRSTWHVLPSCYFFPSTTHNPVPCFQLWPNAVGQVTLGCRRRSQGPALNSICIFRFPDSNFRFPKMVEGIACNTSNGRTTNYPDHVSIPPTPPTFALAPTGTNSSSILPNPAQG